MTAAGSVSSVRDQGPTLIRHRALGSVALVAAALAAFAFADPFHLLLAPWYTAFLVGIALVLAVLWLMLQLRRPLARGLLGLAGMLVLLGWIVFGWASIAFSPGFATVREVAGPPGSGLRLAIVQMDTFAIDGGVFSVRVRAGSGAFLQDSAVWVGLAGGAVPPEARFADARTVEVVGRGGCGYRSTVDPVTLSVDPVHRPLRLDGC